MDAETRRYIKEEINRRKRASLTRLPAEPSSLMKNKYRRKLGQNAYWERMRIRRKWEAQGLVELPDGSLQCMYCGKHTSKYYSHGRHNDGCPKA